MRKQGMDAGFGHHWRLRVEGVLDAIAFLRNGQQVRVSHRIERIALLLRSHAMANGEIVIDIGRGEQDGNSDQYSFQQETHWADSGAHETIQVVG